MNELRRRIDRFFLKNRDKGVRNLMLYIAIVNIAVYALSAIDPSHVVYGALCFSRGAILRGQVWRLFSYAFTYLMETSNVLLGVVGLFCYYQFGRILEQTWGTLKFTLYYISGILLMDVFALIFGGYPTTSHLNLSIFLAIATLAPDSRVFFMFFIPLKMKYLAWIYLGITAFQIIQMVTLFGMDMSLLFPLLALANYFLFFGKNVRNLFTVGIFSNRSKWSAAGNQTRATPNSRPNANWASGYQSKSGGRPYRHKCTVCGKTDTEYPSLEFRYCSRCSGYRCYCMEHINDHAHIVE